MLAGEVLEQLQDKANLDIAYKSLNSFFYRNAFRFLMANKLNAADADDVIQETFIKVFEKIDIHLHVPEGAIPKDGPSAGITIFTSLISSLTEIKIKRDVAMTGEITLKGRVLPIGGLKEKLLAAIRYGIKTVIIPKENEKDLIEIQKDIQNKLTIKKVEFAREVLDIALDGKISKINKKLDWRHIVSESMKQKNQQNQEKSFVN